MKTTAPDQDRMMQKSQPVKKGASQTSTEPKKRNTRKKKPENN